MVMPNVNLTVHFYMVFSPSKRREKTLGTLPDYKSSLYSLQCCDCIVPHMIPILHIVWFLLHNAMELELLLLPNWVKFVLLASDLVFGAGL